MTVAHVRSDTLTGDPYTALLDSTPNTLQVPRSTPPPAGGQGHHVCRAVGARAEAPHRFLKEREVHLLREALNEGVQSDLTSCGL